jgi:hypothetical protein
MAERDPFGRLPDENPLEFLGATSNGTQAAAAEAQAAEQATSSARPATSARPPVQPPRVADYVQGSALDPAQAVRIARRVVRLVVVAAVLFVVFGGVAAVFVGGETDSGDSPVVAVDSDDATPEGALPNATPPPPPAARPPAATPRGLNASSLLTRRNLAPALRRLATSGLGRLYSLSIRPERIDVQLLTRGGRLRSVQLRSVASSTTSARADPVSAISARRRSRACRPARPSASRAAPPSACTGARARSTTSCSWTAAQSCRGRSSCVTVSTSSATGAGASRAASPEPRPRDRLRQRAQAPTVDRRMTTLLHPFVVSATSA